MSIPRSSLFTTPAVEEKSFNSVWVRNINIHCPQLNGVGNTQGGISMELVPYDDTSGAEVIHITSDNEGVEYLNIPNRINGRKSFWEAIEEVPEVAAAMNAIIAAVEPLKTWAETATVIEEPLIEEPPAYEVPAEDPPAEDPPAEDPPAEEVPAEEPPADLEA
jgi:hypothetical protein